jgi:coenzyme F420 hydrogenase subunit beta
VKPLVIRNIVENDLCIGCGLCAAICPSRTLGMGWNRYGEYNPMEKLSCDTECGLCIKVCPFADGNDNEDTIGKILYGNVPGICHLPETGYYADSYVGYAPGTREQGSSGGIATWLLSAFLKKGIVDYVIAVVPNDDPNKLFRFAVLNDPESVLDSAGSAYYPVELAGVLREIQDKSGTYAIIGLPCFIKAIRLAAQKNKKLNERITVTAGLVCGQLKSRHYAEYLSALSGVHEPLEKVFFRGKDPEKPANNYYFSCLGKSGARGKIFWTEGVEKAWVNRWFTPIACNYCDDIFAECADLTFMDAWLPEFTNEQKGTSIVIVRSPLAKDVIDRGIKDGEVCLIPISIEKALESQEGGITIKRHHIANQLYFGHKKTSKIPKKRVAPSNLSSHHVRQEIFLKNRMQDESRKIWDSKNRDAVHLDTAMQPYLTRLKKMNDGSGLFMFPLKAFRHLRRKIRSFSHD